MKEERIGKPEFKSLKDWAKHRAKQAWNWTKDHAVPLAIGTAAAVGGGYLLYRRSKDGEPEEPTVVDQTPEDLSWTGDLIHDRWDSMESRAAESVGPSDDDPEVY